MKNVAKEMLEGNLGEDIKVELEDEVGELAFVV